MCSSSRLPLISKCCCFINLRVSGYLIGVLESLFGLSIVICAVISHFTNEGHKEKDKPTTDEHDNTVQNTVLCVIGSIFILLGVLLVIGVKIKNRVLLKVYIILEIITLIAGFIVYVVILICLFLAFVIASTDTYDWLGSLVKVFAILTAYTLIITIVFVFVIIALKTYFLVCIHSYLNELIKLESGTPLAVGYMPVADRDVHREKV